MANPRAHENGYREFTKYVNVLDCCNSPTCWSIYAEEGVSDEKVVFVRAKMRPGTKFAEFKCMVTDTEKVGFSKYFFI